MDDFLRFEIFGDLIFISILISIRKSKIAIRSDID